MKFSLECNVDSNIIIENEIIYHEKDKTFVLIPDKNKHISSIKIIIKIKDRKSISINFESDPEKKSTI